MSFADSSGFSLFPRSPRWNLDGALTLEREQPNQTFFETGTYLGIDQIEIDLIGTLYVGSTYFVLPITYLATKYVN